MKLGQLHGKPYWFVRGLIAGLTLAWVFEVTMRDDVGPIHRYVAPFVIASLILLSLYDVWRNAQASAAKKSN